MTDSVSGVREIPEGAERTGASPRFDASNLPDALLRDHRTAAGVHGRLVVFEGSLEFVTAAGTVALAKGDVHVVLPQESHRVVPGEGMVFHIEFYK